jgi:ribosome modulation factor
MRPPTKNKALLAAYNRGKLAFYAGQSSHECPYKNNPKGCKRRNGGTWGAVFRNYWRKGWFDAQIADVA